MSYYVGDHAATHSTLNFTPGVTASQYDDTLVCLAGAAWLGDPAATRDLEVPLASLPAGLWSLRLIIDEADLFLGK